MRAPQKTATGPRPRPTPTREFRSRVVGALAIALAASLVIQNAILVWVGAPAYGDPIEKVLTWHTQNRGAVAIAVGSEALNVPLLLGLLTGLHGLVGRRGGAVQMARDPFGAQRDGRQRVLNLVGDAARHLVPGCRFPRP